MTSKTNEWKEREHPAFTERKNIPKEILDTLKMTMPEKQYLSKYGSVISPSDISFGKWEAMAKGDDDVARFDTKEEAMKYCEDFKN